MRLKGYDYSQAGFYFVTMVTRNREYLFGEIVNDNMVLNDAGMMVDRIWHELPQIHVGIDVEQFIIMPNHIHGIIIIFAERRAENRADMESAPTGIPITLGTVVQTFKRYSTIKYIDMVKQNILPPFAKRIWQRNYWDHIIRDENEHQEIVQYIIDNPKKWALDKLNNHLDTP